MNKAEHKTSSHKLFKAGVIFKGLNGLLEVIGGLLLLSISDSDLNTNLAILTQGELSRYPQDFFFRLMSHFVHDISASAKLFGTVYLLSHGLLKIGMAIGLTKKKIWAYPASMIFLALFVTYQLYRLSIAFSVGILILTTLDSLLIWLIWREYQSAISRISKRDEIVGKSKRKR